MSCNPIVSDQENRMLSVVLCGGKSVRMGADKGLMNSGNIVWAQHAYDKLRALSSNVIVSVNESQVADYNELFDTDELIVDNVDISGPLRGLLSVHCKYPSYDLMVTACDMPELKQETLIQLKNIYEDKSGEHDFIVFSNDGELEPLVGVYTSEGLSKIFKLFLAGQLERFSMKYILNIGNTFATELNVSQKKEFKNFNYQKDLVN